MRFNSFAATESINRVHQRRYAVDRWLCANRINKRLPVAGVTFVRYASLVGTLTTVFYGVEMYSLDLQTKMFTIVDVLKSLN